MSDIAIKVEKLGKAYRIGLKEQQHETLMGAFGAFVRAPFENFRAVRNLSIVENGDGKNGEADDIFWALRNISFNVKRGEAIGIIGRNGAGKSTLLKILSRITEPTSGRAEIYGRVGSLLEVGTGFHPDLTGRENVFLNGTVLGMTKREIDSKFDEIIEFSGVEKFIDTPVKRYSSGMRVRLAFSVAAHLEPEILIIDEVLAVGDAEFQKKCLGKMEDVSGQGRTVLFVSHNMIAVQSLCRRAILLTDGTVAMEGNSASIISHHLKSAHGDDRAVEWNSIADAPGADALKIKRVRVIPADKTPGALITMQAPLQIETEYWLTASNRKFHLTYHLMSDQGVVVFTSGCKEFVAPAGTYKAVCAIPGDLLNSGGYFLKLLIVENGNHVVFQRDAIISFTVVDAGERDGAWLGREPGVVQPILKWEIDRVGS